MIFLVASVSFLAGSLLTSLIVMASRPSRSRLARDMKKRFALEDPEDLAFVRDEDFEHWAFGYDRGVLDAADWLSPNAPH